ncbi:MAG: DUF1294 domain-containing protein [Candidatus Kapaibacteriota bacterium]|jgi:uncharacterized membrane protein YsdA (DUF1294 family)
MESYYLLWLATTSLVTFALYGFDKKQAKSNAQRVPERTLHLCALLGGFLGGWLGRLVFRHKTQKTIFAVILMAATLIHVGVLMLLRRHIF